MPAAHEHHLLASVIVGHAREIGPLDRAERAAGPRAKSASGAGRKLA
jgi:hypothetical protein